MYDTGCILNGSIPSYEKRSTLLLSQKTLQHHETVNGVFGVKHQLFVRTADVSVFTTTPAEADAVPCARSFRKRNGLMHQKENVLDAPYYHVVFTVPEELNSINLQQPEAVI